MTVTVKCAVVSRFATRERPAPQVVDAQAETNHFERVSLLAAGLALCVEHLAEVVEVSPQARVRLGGIQINARITLLQSIFQELARDALVAQSDDQGARVNERMITGRAGLGNALQQPVYRPPWWQTVQLHHLWRREGRENFSIVALFKNARPKLHRQQIAWGPRKAESSPKEQVTP